MEVKDLRADTSYATCDGQRLELVVPVHARWAKTEEGAFVELDDDALGNKRTDPWGKCHRVTAQIGVRVRRYAKDDVDRDGEVREGAVPTEMVVMPRDIAGTWRDYLVLHGATVRQHALDLEAESAKERYEDDVRAAVGARLGVDVDNVSINVHTYRREVPEWDISISLTPEQVALIAAEHANA